MLFYLKHKRTIIRIVCVIAIVILFMLWNMFRGTEIFMNLKINYSFQAIKELFANEKTYLSDLAYAMLAESDSTAKDVYYYVELDRYGLDDSCTQSELILSKMLHDFSRKNKRLFETIRTLENGSNEYPADIVIFSRWIRRYSDVYCWVDLVFCESGEIEEWILEYPLAEKLESGWYIVMRYGY